ncbi:hypothetical protein EVG20_g3893 [Dentipellis fragilis]|uniref:Uncharacterized protein n=1 Tax=Dentipellis fragilis TaxID=205917 RepID=A0A4Y9YZ06_9AGAM|nr:hypothetical protein EVG20_g3893 [Dentipellis fragilis]
MLLQGIFNILASAAFVAALPGHHRRQDTTVVTTTTPVVTTATETATTEVTTTAPVTTTATETATATTEVTTTVSATATETATTSETTPPESSTAPPESSSTEATTSLTASAISVTTTSVSSLPVTSPSTTLTTETPVSSTLTTEIPTSITSVVTAPASITTTVSVSATGTESGSASVTSSVSEASVTSSASESSASEASTSSVSAASSSATGTESAATTTLTTTVPIVPSSTASISGTLTTSVPVVPSSVNVTSSPTPTITTSVPVVPSSVNVTSSPTPPITSGSVSVSGTFTTTIPVVPSSVNVTSSPTPTITSGSVSVSGTLTTTIPVVITGSVASEAPTTSGSVFVSGSITTTIPVAITSIPIPPPGSVPSPSSPLPPSSSVTTVSGITGTGTRGPGPTVSVSFAPSPTPVVGPAGGIGLNETPQYKPQSDYDVQSLNLALQQEILELSLFQFGLDRFNSSDFQTAGLGANDIALIQFLVAQQLDHVQLLQNILAPNVSEPCNYTFPLFTDARAFIDYSQKITRVGESGALGFLPHLNAQDVAQLLLQTVTVGSRQQTVFRQLEGLFPFPSAFTPVITQNMQWTLLAPIISTCPTGNPAIEWQSYPSLHIENNPFWPDIPLDNTTAPAITQNRTQVSFPGREVLLSWDSPGQQVGFNNSSTNSSAGPPQFVAWISELNITYTPLNNISGTTGSTEQPGGFVFDDGLFPVANDTIFILVTDAAPFVTPYNLSQIESHIVAGPAIYQAG